MPAAPSLLDALGDLDNLARLSARAWGERSRLGSALLQGVAQVRKAVAPAALAQAAQVVDPKADLMRIFAAAEAAGLSWPDLADALNHYHERHFGRG